jgi:hypothetical protein
LLVAVTAGVVSRDCFWHSEGNQKKKKGTESVDNKHRQYQSYFLCNNGKESALSNSVSFRVNNMTARNQQDQQN